jgi:hypothetical protein
MTAHSPVNCAGNEGWPSQAAATGKSTARLSQGNHCRRQISIDLETYSHSIIKSFGKSLFDLMLAS